jgi:3-deoxy-7-phosphoheptulonate synthase
MLITVRSGADPAEVQKSLVALGLWVRPLVEARAPVAGATAGASAGAGGARTHFLVEACSSGVDPSSVLSVPGVEAVAESRSPHPLLDRQGPSVRVGRVTIGGEAGPVWMAGPCSIESAAHIDELAAQLAGLGVQLLRGGAFKPRSSPYSFQGHGLQALGWMREAARRRGLGVVTEALDAADVGAVAEMADLIQIGSRNMQNFALLKAAGQTGRPVLLKRGMAATLDEWRLAAEYCLVHGAAGVVLCERGIRGFDPSTRNLLDLGAVALLAHHHRLPVVVDPSHATGRRDLIAPLSRAALAAGAAGLLIEVHASPGEALSDGPQALLPEELGALIGSVTRPAERTIS